MDAEYVYAVSSTALSGRGAGLVRSGSPHSERGLFVLTAVWLRLREAARPVDSQWTELSAKIDSAMRDNPTNNLVLSQAAVQLSYLGRPEEAIAMADLALRLIPQMPMGRRALLVQSYFLGRKFERAIEVGDQIPEESRNKFSRFFRAASYALLDRAEDAERAKADLIAKNDE